MPEDTRRSFDDLIDEAVSALVEGWDFSFLTGRVETPELPWSYAQDAARLVSVARRVLDVDTGGGEVFASLVPPDASVAVEPHPPNVPVARRRLEPLGVKVVARTDSVLPVGDGCFDLVLNRHGWLDLDETARVLEPGGRFLSQQVGANNATDNLIETTYAMTEIGKHPLGGGCLSVANMVVSSATLMLPSSVAASASMLDKQVVSARILRQATCH